VLDGAAHAHELEDVAVDALPRDAELVRHLDVRLHLPPIAGERQAPLLPHFRITFWLACFVRLPGQSSYRRYDDGTRMRFCRTHRIACFVLMHMLQSMCTSSAGWKWCWVCGSRVSDSLK